MIWINEEGAEESIRLRKPSAVPLDSIILIKNLSIVLTRDTRSYGARAPVARSCSASLASVASTPSKETWDVAFSMPWVTSAYQIKQNWLVPEYRVFFRLLTLIRFSRISRPFALQKAEKDVVMEVTMLSSNPTTLVTFYIDKMRRWDDGVHTFFNLLPWYGWIPDCRQCSTKWGWYQLSWAFDHQAEFVEWMIRRWIRTLKSRRESLVEREIEASKGVRCWHYDAMELCSTFWARVIVDLS
jgi:hypothetical protein